MIYYILWDNYCLGGNFIYMRKGKILKISVLRFYLRSQKKNKKNKSRDREIVKIRIKLVIIVKKGIL